MLLSIESTTRRDGFPSHSQNISIVTQGMMGLGLSLMTRISTPMEVVIVVGLLNKAKRVLEGITYYQ